VKDDTTGYEGEISQVCVRVYVYVREGMYAYIGMCVCVCLCVVSRAALST